MEATTRNATRFRLKIIAVQSQGDPSRPTALIPQATGLRSLSCGKIRIKKLSGICRCASASLKAVTFDRDKGSTSTECP